MMLATLRERPPFHILGAGSIGLLWAAKHRTADPTYPVTLLLRDSHPIQRSDHSIECYKTMSWKQDPTQEVPTHILLPSEHIVRDLTMYTRNNRSVNDTGHAKIETLLVTTKSYQAKEAVESILHRLHPSYSRIVLLCNGALSVQDELDDILPKDHKIPVVLATTTHGAFQEVSLKDHSTTQQETHQYPSHILVHAGVGKTFIDRQAQDLGDVWDSVGFQCSTLSTSAMKRLLWQKLAANCVINPLTALNQCTNGMLLDIPDFPQWQEDLVDEIMQVAHAATAQLSEEEETDDQLIQKESLRKFVNQVISDTKHNKSSMFQDVLRQKRTEAEHLNGFVVRKGREFGIDCPANQHLLSRVLELQAGWS